MGWDTTYNAGPTKPFLIENTEGDPLGCNVCGWYADKHPRIAFEEIDRMYGKEPTGDPHEFVPHVQRYRVLDYAQVGWTEVYMAVECLTDSYLPVGSVFATVTLIHRDRAGSLSKKDMSEASHPYYYRCPERILDRLSPADMYGEPKYALECKSHYRCEREPDAEHPGQHQDPDNMAASAIEWRRRCREYHATRRAAPKLRKGCKVRFAKPIHFSDGSDRADFEFIKGSQFRDGYTRCHITNWREMQYEVLA